jgi:hypothetical protein
MRMMAGWPDWTFQDGSSKEVPKRSPQVRIAITMIIGCLDVWKFDNSRIGDLITSMFSRITRYIENNGRQNFQTIQTAGQRLAEVPENVQGEGWV